MCRNPDITILSSDVIIRTVRCVFVLGHNEAKGKTMGKGRGRAGRNLSECKKWKMFNKKKCHRQTDGHLVEVSITCLRPDARN